MEGNGWIEYRNMVLAELERLNKRVDEINNKLDRINIDIATLKVKASLWGGLSGAIVAVGALLLKFVV